ncbi:33 kDa chaperonin HslO [hydrothermal vent metagenome]|uniref:33 kDa chaperonin HslO n=1 Tax=hydrothermal vent metagenome TaxID=652676 RepID=A0A3B0YIR7_9ZZZZ
MTADSDTDCLRRFIFENTDVRGELVWLDASWRAVLERQSYPDPIRDLLGQAMAAALLLSATIKFDGYLQLQLQGDGPLSLLMIEATAARTVRGIARWDGDVDGKDFRTLTGEARLMLTIDPGKGGERYQGVVLVEGDSLAKTLEDYFSQSEQLATRLWLAANGDRAGGMLLQQLPGDSHDEEDWNRDVMLGETLTDEELLQLSAQELLHRLYHEEDLRLFETEPVSFRCSCSSERIESMLRGLGYDEVRDILGEQGEVSVDCEFCCQSYVYDTVDVERVFAAADQPDVPRTRH